MPGAVGAVNPNSATDNAWDKNKHMFGRIVEEDDVDSNDEKPSTGQFQEGAAIDYSKKQM